MPDKPTTLHCGADGCVHVPSVCVCVCVCVCVYEVDADLDVFANNIVYSFYDSPLLSPAGIVSAINGSAGRWIKAACLPSWLQESGYKLIMMSRSGQQLRQLNSMFEAGQLTADIDSVHPFSAEGCAAACTNTGGFLVVPDAG